MKRCDVPTHVVGQEVWFVCLDEVAPMPQALDMTTATTLSGPSTGRQPRIGIFKDDSMWTITDYSDPFLEYHENAAWTFETFAEAVASISAFWNSYIKAS